MFCPLYDTTVIGFKAPDHNNNNLCGLSSCTQQTLQLLDAATMLAKSTSYLKISCDPNIWSPFFRGTPLVQRRESKRTSYERKLSSISEEESIISNVEELPPTSPESLESFIHLDDTFRGTYGMFRVSPGSRFFVIKSFSADDIESSRKNRIWTSTALGNKRLDKAYAETDAGSIFLFYSVNSSMKFCGVARMEDRVNFSSNSDVWAENARWNGVFPVSWLVVKDISNRRLKHLTVPKNENKPVTCSRDTQEIPFDVGLAMLEKFVE